MNKNSYTCTSSIEMGRILLYIAYEHLLCHYHLSKTGDDVFTAPCGVVELTCEELGAVSPSVTGIV